MSTFSAGKNGHKMLTFTLGTTPEDIIRERFQESRPFDVRYNENDFMMMMRLVNCAWEYTSDPEVLEWAAGWRSSALTVLGIEEV